MSKMLCLRKSLRSSIPNSYSDYSYDVHCKAAEDAKIFSNYSRSQAEGVIHALPLATQDKEKHDCRILAKCDFCIKHGFKMRFFLTVFSLST